MPAVYYQSYLRDLLRDLGCRRLATVIDYFDFVKRKERGSPSPFVFNFGWIQSFIKNQHPDRPYFLPLFLRRCQAQTGSTRMFDCLGVLSHIPTARCRCVLLISRKHQFHGILFAYFSWCCREFRLTHKENAPRLRPTNFQHHCNFAFLSMECGKVSGDHSPMLMVSRMDLPLDEAETSYSKPIETIAC